MKIFYQYMEIAMSNAFNLYKMHKKDLKMTRLQFRIDVLHSLLAEYREEKNIEITKGKYMISNILKEIKEKTLNLCKLEKGKWPYNCSVCSKRTIFKCKTCIEMVCPFPCYDIHI